MSNEYHVMSEEEFLSRLADNTTFSNIELRDAEIQENISYDLVLSQCKFVRCRVQNSVWENVRASSSIGSDLSGASLRFTKFAQADLRGAVLGQLDVRTTDLQGTKIFDHQMRGLLENCGIIIFPDRR